MVASTARTQFSRQNYLNLETFRKTGVAVKTPVWFVEDHDTLYVTTMAQSGKIKRVRRNPRVRVVPCNMRGNPRGEWIEAHAEVITNLAVDARINQLLNRKYGLLKWIFEQFRSANQAMVTIKITLQP